MSESIRFQNYELLRREDGSIFELGRGAMGVTYKALDTDLHCHVALKVIGPGVLGSEEARERFIREARAAAKLHHPNIATVFRLGRSDDDTHFYAMEFCDGPTLEQALAARGPFAAGEALGIARQVCKALMQAEQHHLLHRDLKPSNLILTTRPDEGTVVKVIDFGLAKSLADGQQSLASRGVGGFVGTAHFASPEQLEEHDLDIRSDIYSLGVCLWFMLEGRPPFAGSLARVMSQALAVEPPWERLAGQPAAVIALLRRLLAKDREARPRAALALRQELDECLHAIDSAGPATDTPTVAAPPRAPASASPFATRFQISERLGRDALGRIFRATDRESSGALVAYHVIDPALLSVPATRRGLEAQLTAARGHPHPHLANVLAFSSTPPSLAFATEWINGFSLLDLLKERGALLPFEVVRLLTPLAAAADHASRHGIHGVPLSKQQVHLHFPRGLSKNERPTVLAAPFEGWPPHAVKAEVLALSDGAAAVAGGMQSMMTFVPARSGNRAGTPTAVPALASLACELLGAHIGTTFAPIARLSEAGNAVLRRALTEDQAFPNASAFTQALAAAIGKTGPTSPPKKRAPHSSSPPGTRSRFAKSVRATLLVLALTAAAFGYYHGIHQPRQRDREKRLADAEAPDRKMREPEELRSATVPEQTEAPTHIADPSPAPVSPSPAQPAAAPSSLPAKVAKPRFVLRHKFPAVAGSGSGEYGKQFGDDFVFSPNGRWIAVRDREKDQQTIRAWDLETGTSPWMINRRQRPMLHFGFSPDSRWFVVAGGDYGDLLVFRGEVLFAHAATGRVFAHHHGEADLFSSSGFLFSPNSESLITWSGFHGTIDVWGTISGVHRRHIAGTATSKAFAPGYDWISDLLVAPDSAAFAAGNPSRWGQWSLPGGEGIQAPAPGRVLLPGGLRRRAGLIDQDKATSPESVLNVSVKETKTIVVRDQRGKLLRELEGSRYDVRYVGFSPDGAILASLSYLDPGGDEGVHASEAILWDVQSWEPLVKLPSSGDSIAAFSPDARFFVLGSGDITVFEREPVPSASKQWSPFEAISEDQPISTNPTTSTPPMVATLNAPLTAPVLNNAMLRAFCEKLQRDEQTHDLTRILENYAASVDYLDQGVVGQDEILQDKRSYFERWPKTTYRLKDDITVLSNSPDRAEVRFQVEFSAEKLSGERISGIAEQTIAVTATGGLRVVSQKSRVLSSEKTNSATPAPKAESFTGTWRGTLRPSASASGKSGFFNVRLRINSDGKGGDLFVGNEHAATLSTDEIKGSQMRLTGKHRFPDGLAVFTIVANKESPARIQTSVRTDTANGGWSVMEGRLSK